ncbi:MAG: site-2 protease family protein [Actinomycetota bacterium]
MTQFRFALYLAGSLLVGMSAREFARASVASRLHDPTPRLWGRLTFNPKAWFEPFGSGLLPALILFLWGAGATFLPPPVAYAKPAPVDPNYFRNRTRDTIVTSLAGPVANLAFAAVGGMALRTGIAGEAGLVALAFMLANLSLLVFHLVPIPGLDGARMLALVLPPRAAEVYRNADQYLPLIVLIVLFIFAGPLISIVNSLTDSLCSLLAGLSCPP